MKKYIKASVGTDGGFPVWVEADWNLVAQQIEDELSKRFGDSSVSNLRSIDKSSAVFSIDCNDTHCDFSCRCYINSWGYGVVELIADKGSYTGTFGRLPYESYAAASAKKLVDKILFMFE